MMFEARQSQLTPEENKANNLIILMGNNPESHKIWFRLTQKANLELTSDPDLARITAYRITEIHIKTGCRLH